MQKIIGIKELHKDLKKISKDTQKGESFLVVKNSKPVFRIEPLKEYKVGKYTLEDMKKIAFKTSDKHLSKKIDSVAYKV